MQNSQRPFCVPPYCRWQHNPMDNHVVAELAGGAGCGSRHGRACRSGGPMRLVMGRAFHVCTERFLFHVCTLPAWKNVPCVYFEISAGRAMCVLWCVLLDGRNVVCVYFGCFWASETCHVCTLGFGNAPCVYFAACAPGWPKRAMCVLWRWVAVGPMVAIVVVRAGSTVGALAPRPAAAMGAPQGQAAHAARDSKGRGSRRRMLVRWPYGAIACGTQ